MCTPYHHGVSLLAGHGIGLPLPLNASYRSKEPTMNIRSPSAICAPRFFMKCPCGFTSRLTFSI